MKARFAVPLAGLGILLMVALLYLPYKDSPAMFDDVYFFLQPSQYVGHLSWSGLLDRRWVSMATLALTHWLWSTEYRAYHIGNLLLHALTAFSLFIFVRDVLAHDERNRAALPAFIVAMLFALHPVAAFAVGYIIERSIILAGLLSLWMWIAVHRGVSGERKSWLLISTLCYFLAVFAKEHAVTALLVALLVAWNATGGNLRKALSALSVPLPLWIITAVIIVLRFKGIVGSAPEPLLGEMGVDITDTHDYLARNAVNQGWLFFKYALYWLFPKETWMAIDMRESFPPGVFAWPWTAGFAAFLAYPALVVFLSWRRLLARAVVVGLLSPWLLFLTMFSAVHYQESFVLYRSYLWALPFALSLAFLLSKAQARGQVAVLLIVGVFCFGSAWSRLQTFSHPILVWEEAAARLEGQEDVPGAYRIYHNRGIAYSNEGGVHRALALLDFNKVVRLNPSFPYVYNDRGAVYLSLGDYAGALQDFDQAIRLKPDYVRPHLGRGLVLIKLGRTDEGLTGLAYACRFGVGCTQYREELANAERSAQPSVR